MGRSSTSCSRRRTTAGSSARPRTTHTPRRTPAPTTTPTAPPTIAQPPAPRHQREQRPQPPSSGARSWRTGAGGTGHDAAQVRWPRQDQQHRRPRRQCRPPGRHRPEHPVGDPLQPEQPGERQAEPDGEAHQPGGAAHQEADRVAADTRAEQEHPDGQHGQHPRRGVGRRQLGGDQPGRTALRPDRLRRLADRARQPGAGVVGDLPGGGHRAQLPGPRSRGEIAQAAGTRRRPSDRRPPPARTPATRSAARSRLAAGADRPRGRRPSPRTRPAPARTAARRPAPRDCRWTSRADPDARARRAAARGRAAAVLSHDHRTSTRGRHREQDQRRCQPAAGRCCRRPRPAAAPGTSSAADTPAEDDREHGRDRDGRHGSISAGQLLDGRARDQRPSAAKPTPATTSTLPSAARLTTPDLAAPGGAGRAPGRGG